MKKLLTFICFIFLTSFKSEKKVKIELTIQQLNSLMYVIDESKAEHSTVVKPLQQMLVEQIKPQLDSTGNIK